MSSREILVYGIWESLHHRNILEFSSLMIFYGHPMLHQSSPGETGQLLGITTSTLAREVRLWKLFVLSANFWCIHNTLLDYACPVWNPQQASFSTNSIMSNVIHLDWSRGMILHLTIGTKLLIFQLHIYVKVTSVLLQLFKFIKSDFAANLED